MDSFTVAAFAMAVLLSAIVRIIRTDAAWKAVEEGYAGAEHMRDLTGIAKKAALQEVFGPPTMEGVFHVTRIDVQRGRRFMGHLMGDLRLDGASILVGLVALIWRPYGIAGDILNLFLFAAVAYQIVGWGATTTLMNDKS